MNAKDFLPKANNLLSAFLREQLAKLDGLPSLQLKTTLPTNPGESLKEPKTSFFSRFTDDRHLNLFLLPYEVYRVEAHRLQRAQTEEKFEDGAKIVIRRRAAEAYRVKYLIAGPSLGSELGQTLVSALISVFFDHTQISTATDAGASEVLKLLEGTSNRDEAAVQLLAERGLNLTPLYVFEVEAQISTGSILAKDKVVQQRVIDMRTAAGLSSEVK